MQFGINQVPRRVFGFKADYFAVMANALTTECVFLDGAAHQVCSFLINLFMNHHLIKFFKAD